MGIVATVAVGWLLLYKLGSLTGGMASGEVVTAAAPVGWHGMYAHAFNLPLKLIRSVIFWSFPSHGQTLTRLPNALLGALTIVEFGALVYIWHGRRTAILATAMFATSAWTLHVSRLASLDVVYLWSLPTLLLSHFSLRKYHQYPAVWLASLMAWGLLLYVPGMVWFVVIDIILQARFVAAGWRSAKSWWLRLLYIVIAAAPLPLLAITLSRPGNMQRWLGLPAHFDSVRLLIKHFAAVPTHLFIRGPEYPQLWLGRAPILDVFTLAACVLGLYFYSTHWRAARSRYLAFLALFGFILVGIGGPVSLSLLVPLLYVAAATGLAYLLHEWLKIFPNNPLARSLGIGIVVVAVGLSCLYNYRAYFVAWPHSATTKATFQYHRHP